MFIFIASIWSASVTFNVDMSEEDVGDEGPSLWMGHLWPQPGQIMENLDGDNVWSLTIDLEPGAYTFKYRNGWWTGWEVGEGWESLLNQECAVGQYQDREIIVTDEDMVLDTVCFSSCTEQCTTVTESEVTFRVNMNSEELSDNDIVYVHGTFNGWCNICNPMSDVDDDGIWELTISLPVGSYEYLFTINGWDGTIGGAILGSDCDFNPTDDYANYGFNLEEQSLLLDPFCFGRCEQCEFDDLSVTFNVDMNGQFVDDLGVFLIGNFQDTPWDIALPIEMTDDNNDGVYSVTLTFQSEDYLEYKFQNGLTYETDEGLGICGNNVCSTCNSPSDDCNNRDLLIPPCVKENDDSDCISEDIVISSSGFNTNDCSGVVDFIIDMSNSGYPNQNYPYCHINGSWSADENGNWGSWGSARLIDIDGDGVYSAGQIIQNEGSYEYIIFCSDEICPYTSFNDNTFVKVEPGQDTCDNDSEDEYANYSFNLDSNYSDINLCAGTCDESCACSATGDVNSDNVVNVVDIVALVSFVLGTNSPSGQQICESDINQDGLLNVVDIVALVAIVLGN
tara:strand:- start:483 stop:2174 length:1692 start_codon:yes stop_codon:yes gene_type:complete